MTALLDRRRRSVSLASPGVSGPPSVLIVDDHAVFAEAVATAFERSDDFADVRWAQSADRTMEMAREFGPDLAIIDLRMPDSPGTTLISDLLELADPPKILVLSVAADARSILNAFEAGASGFLGKHESFEAVMAAAHAVLGGDNPISASAFSRLLPRIVKTGADLTEQEERVLGLMAAGMSNDDIGEELSISSNTARNHVSRVLKKLDSDNRSEAVATARRQQLIPPDGN